MDNFNRKGWIVFKGIVKNCDEICSSVIDDTIRTVFEPEGEMDNVRNCPASRRLQLLVDAKLRRQYLRNERCVWEHGNSRKPKVSKNSGLCNLYHNPQVRDKVLFDPQIYQCVQACYTQILGKETRLVYKNGPDRVCLKPPGATEMPKHIDTHLTQSVQHHRVQTVVTLQAAGQTCDGSTELLEGYTVYFDAGCYWFGQHPQFFSLTLPQQLGSDFDNYLPDFNAWLDQFYLDGRLRSGLNCPFSLPEERIPISWVQPSVEAGDILCFDQRTPHRNTKNCSSVTRVACFVSLYPIEQWNRNASLLDIFTGCSADRNGGSNRSGEAEKKLFAENWIERTKIDVLDSHVQTVLGLN